MCSSVKLNNFFISNFKLYKSGETNFKIFSTLFNITFNQCLSHFIGKEFIEELEGMKCFEDIKDTLGDDVEYINLVKYYLENFENIVKNKNPRRPKKSKN